MKDWEQFELEIAQEEGGKRQPLSGAGKQKQDVITKEYLISAKETKAKSYSIKLEDLEELERDAAMNGKLPKMEIRFTTGRIGHKDWVLVPKEQL